MSTQPQLGALQTPNCDTASNYNTGCSILSPSTNTYGSGFNTIAGGVYATEWTSSYIKVWFFPRNAIPYNIKTGKPEPSTWNTPQAYFKGGPSCNIDSHFKKHQIIFDTTFCGAYGDGAWGSDPTCSRFGTSCENFVAGNPEAFKNA